MFGVCFSPRSPSVDNDCPISSRPRCRLGKRLRRVCDAMPRHLVQHLVQRPAQHLVHNPAQALPISFTGMDERCLVAAGGKSAGGTRLLGRCEWLLSADIAACQEILAGPCNKAIIPACDEIGYLPLIILENGHSEISSSLVLCKTP